MNHRKQKLIFGAFALITVILFIDSILEIRQTVSNSIRSVGFRHFYKSTEIRWENDLYTVSATYDDRPGCGVNASVRIILVRYVKRFEDLKCEFTDRLGRVLSSANSTIKPIGVGMWDKGKYHREEVYSCTIRRDIRPYFVVINDQAPTGETFSLARLPIYYPLKTEKKRPIISCVPAVYLGLNETRLIEWIELQRLLNMSHIEFHSMNLTKKAEKFLRSYTKEGGDGLVTLIPLRNYTKHGLLSSVAINNCMFRNMHLYDAVAVYDHDEIILPRTTSSYPKLLKLLHRKYDEEDSVVTQFNFINVHYFLDLPDRPKASPYSVITRKFKHVVPQPPGDTIKSIVDSQVCYAMHNHYCWTYLPHLPKKPISISVDLKYGANQHYKMCHVGKKHCRKLLNTTFEEKSVLRFEKPLLKLIKKKRKSYYGDD